MNTNSKLVPKRRFKEFVNADAWEQRKLGDYAKFRRGSFPQPYGKSEWYDGERAMPFVQVVDVSNNLKLVEDTKQKISKMAQPMSVFVPKGKVLVTLQGSIGRVAITQYEAFVDRTILIFEDFSECTDEYFWAYTIQNKFDIEKKIAPGGTIKTITKEALSVFDIQLPKIEEQKRIGLFFTNLDNLITLHQRKLEKMKNMKAAYLTEMFPQKGETVPKRRFAGFTDAWEQRKFGDVGSVAMCKRIFKEQTSEEGDIPFYKIGTFGGTPDAYISRELFEEYKKAYQYPSKGDILISASGSIGRTVEYTGEDEYFQDSNIVWLKHGDDIDNSFLKVLYSVVEWSCEGSTIKRLYNDNFLKTEFMIPDIKEQIKIGEYFGQFDNLITLHQRKLEKLQNIKKAYLNEMFV